MLAKMLNILQLVRRLPLVCQAVNRYSFSQIAQFRNMICDLWAVWKQKIFSSLCCRFHCNICRSSRAICNFRRCNSFLLLLLPHERLTWKAEGRSQARTWRYLIDVLSAKLPIAHIDFSYPLSPDSIGKHLMRSAKTPPAGAGRQPTTIALFHRATSEWMDEWSQQTCLPTFDSQSTSRSAFRVKK